MFTLLYVFTSLSFSPDICSFFSLLHLFIYSSSHSAIPSLYPFCLKKQHKLTSQPNSNESLHKLIRFNYCLLNVRLFCTRAGCGLTISPPIGTRFFTCNFLLNPDARRHCYILFPFWRPILLTLLHFGRNGSWDSRENVMQFTQFEAEWLDGGKSFLVKRCKEEVRMGSVGFSRASAFKPTEHQFHVL